MLGALGRCGLIRVTLVVLALINGPGSALEAMQRPHCARDETSVIHSSRSSVAHHTHSDAGRGEWNPSHQQDCPHCPASECARAAACAGATAPALSPAGFRFVALPEYRVAEALASEQAASASTPPHTPPPQPIP